MTATYTRTNYGLQNREEMMRRYCTHPQARSIIGSIALFALPTSILWSRFDFRLGTNGSESYPRYAYMLRTHCTLCEIDVFVADLHQLCGVRMAPKGALSLCEPSAEDGALSTALEGGELSL